MKKLGMLSAAVTLGVLVVMSGAVSTVPVMAATWKCSANKLKNYRYTGGSRAMIHLSPYKSGGSYSVKKVSSTKVTGKTKDGTVFTCILQ